jgi:hypothetical protein
MNTARKFEVVKDNKMDTNLLLKKVIRNWSNHLKSSFVHETEIDIEKCHPEDFTNKKYNYNKHIDDWFLFIDNNYRLIGLLKGSDRQNFYDKYEDDPLGLTAKNRKHLRDYSSLKFVLRVPETKCNYKSNKEIKREKGFNKKYFPTKYEAKRRLRDRLEEYKRNKYNNINNIEMMTQNLIGYLNGLLFKDNSEVSQIVSKVNKLHNQYRTIDYTSYEPESIEDIIKLIMEATKYYKDRKKKETGGFYFEQMWKSKLVLIKIYNTIMK